MTRLRRLLPPVALLGLGIFGGVVGGSSGGTWGGGLADARPERIGDGKPAAGPVREGEEDDEEVDFKLEDFLPGGKVSPIPGLPGMDGMPGLPGMPGMGGGKMDARTLLKKTDAIARKVARIRGLPVKKKIARGVMNREQIKKRLLERFDDEYTPQLLAAEERMLKRFGLLAAEANYKQVVIDMLTDQVAGFYDPKTKELYIADWIDGSMQVPVMAHEIDHALQDQSFNLMKFVQGSGALAAKTNTDAQLARQALVEGDGLAVMVEYVMKDSPMGAAVDPWADDSMVEALKDEMAKPGGGPAFERAPLYLREALVFPYKGGLDLVAKTRRHHAWSRVDKMFRDPPQSTEQVLHPQKYFSGEKPVAIRVPQVAYFRGWKTVYDNVLGELVFGIFFRQHGLAKARADAGAAGWGGDRFLLLAPPDDPGKTIDDLVIVSTSVWDSPVDAQEAFEATREALPKVAGARALTETTPAYAAARHKAADVSFVERKGNRVLLVIGAPQADAARIRKELWAGWKK